MPEVQAEPLEAAMPSLLSSSRIASPSMYSKTQKGSHIEHPAGLVYDAYCLMTNHDLLLLEAPDANLSKGMRQLNGVYTQDVNRTHGRVEHLFQGRFKAILVGR